MANLNFNELNKSLSSYSYEQATKLLEKEGRRLKYIAIKLWRKYLESYKPKMYVRTRKSQKSIKLGKVHLLADGSLGIELTWENDLTYHDSVFGKEYPQGHSIMLISDGWHSKKLESKYGKRIDRFTYFEGTGYLYQVYKEYTRTAPKGVWIDVQWSGQYTKK